MEAFRQLGLSEEFVKVLENLGLKEPRDIQAKAIPLALGGKDVIGGSATGSGKTLAFGASIIERSSRGRGIQALILTPTRELAEQVASSLEKFSSHKRLFVAAVYGGVAIGPQVTELRKADIVVGTPGRILDHMQRGSLNLSRIQTLVLDEADRMLDMGFIEDVDRIISACPRVRQTLLFSATITPDIHHMAKRYMKDPVPVSLMAYVDPSKLRQIYYDVPQERKFSLLFYLLKHEHPGLIMVFCNTQRTTDFVARHLLDFGIDAVGIHGGLTQSKRTRIMEQFSTNRVGVLVCTDVAARGLDIKGVSHVYNYDIPATSKEYIHRIGRTARAGKEGIAISIVSSRDYENFRKVLDDESLNIQSMTLPHFEDVRVRFRSFSRQDFRQNRRDRRDGGRIGRIRRDRRPKNEWKRHGGHHEVRRGRGKPFYRH